MATEYQVQSPPTNPDAQAVVSEYIDYTEYLHCDITRSLSLIHKLDRDYGACAAVVHEIASDYCRLKSPSDNNNNDKISNKDVYDHARALRIGMSASLNSALKDREESVAEAIKLYETVDRHFNRLSEIIRKLQKINVTPRPPVTVSSRDIQKSKSDSQMRITLRVDGQRRPIQTPHPVRPQTPRTSISTSRTPISRKYTDEKRGRKKDSQPKQKTAAITSYTSYIPPMPESSSESDWDEIPAVPPVLTESDRRSTLRHKYIEGDDDFLPWFELLPGELAILRKRMKKNSSWQPSDAMMLKQLESLHRGVRGFRKWAKRTNQDKSEVDKILSGDTGSPTSIAIGALKRSQDNKGMRLNIMKRAKREREKAEAAAAAAAIGPQVVDNIRSRAEAKSVSHMQDRPRGISKKITSASIDAIDSSSPESKTILKRSKSASLDKRKNHDNHSRASGKDEGRPARSSRNSKNETIPKEQDDGQTRDEESDDDMPIDPNEPTYCLCNRISFGTMVGCDNEDCPKEWFHMECVGLKAEPSKNVKWFCPLCRDDPTSNKKDSTLKAGRKRRKIGR